MKLSRAGMILSGFLCAQALAYYGLVARTETIPPLPGLQNFPKQLGEWSQVREGVVEKEVLEVLRADEVITRTYGSASRSENPGLFVAFFQSQRNGKAPHSPKNCLPGSGWVPSVSDIISLQVPGRAEPIEVNRYIVQKGDSKSLVMYWYQSRDRVVANEYSAKRYVVQDAIQYNRTDTSLVRIIVDIRHNNVDAAQKAAEDFVRTVFPALRKQLPS